MVLNGDSVQDLRMLFYQSVVYFHVEAFSFDLNSYNLAVGDTASDG